jgi:hypothetical protein
MIRCVRIWTGDDRNSHFEEGVIDLEPGQRGDVLSGRMATTTISFEETAPGGAFARRAKGSTSSSVRATSFSPRTRPAADIAGG